MAKKAASTKKTTVSTKKTTAAKKINPADSKIAQSVELIPSGTVAAVRMQVGELFEEWKDVTENNLTLLQRRRKTGPGTSNYGFVDQVSDIAVANPEYAHFININDLKNAIRNIEVCRELFGLLQGFARSISNTMMVYATEAFDLALDYYSQVKLRADRGDPRAIELYRILNIRFKRPRRRKGEPTAKEIERDVHEILAHKKDGEIIVKGKTPKVTGGKTEVIDDVHTGKTKFKGTEDGQADN